MKGKIIAIIIALVAVTGSIIAIFFLQQRGYLTEIIQILPDDINLVSYVNAESLAEDPDLEYWHNSLVDNTGRTIEDVIGIDLSGAQALVTAYTSFYEGFIIVIKGDFDLEDVRDALIENDFIKGEYEGENIWTWTEEPLAVVFVKEMIIFGVTDSVKAVVYVNQNDELTLYSDEDIKSIVDRLPVGISSAIYRGEEAFGDISAVAGGTSITKGNGVLEIKGWFKFESEADAEAALQDVKDLMNDMWNTTDMDGRLRGQFIELTGETAIPTE
ncbi:MAG: hypothetical protein JSV77_01770 [Dehalococcoidales bacterium]|nr:MAG: hypothetical protein JSV77_01770 [Dehalococcoidales bacterium]